MRHISKAYFWIFVSLLFVALRLPSLFEPYWYGDEGIYLVLGQGIQKGLTLYRQIHDNKPPTLYYLAALGQTVFGFRLLLALWLIPAFFFFYKITSQFLKPIASKIALVLFIILCSIPVIEGHIANAEIFMVLPTLAAFYLFFNKLTNARFLTIGILLGFAFTLKVPVAAEALLLAVWFFFVTKEKQKIIKLIFFGLGFAFPILLWGIYFLIKGALPEFIFASLLQNFGYLSSWSTGTHSGSATQGGIVTRFLFLAISWIVLYILSKKKIISLSNSFLLAWFAATLFGTLLSTRPYPHYLIQLAPPLVLLLVNLFSHKLSLTTLLSLFALGSLTFSLIKYKFYFYPVVSYYQNFYQYILRQKSVDNYRSYFGGVVNRNYQISEYIKSKTSPNDKIFVWGDEPFIYALSNRLPTGRYTVAYHIVDFQAYEPTLNALKTHPPKLIVYCHMDSRPFAQLDQFINRYYSLSDQFDRCLIYSFRE